MRPSTRPEGPEHRGLKRQRLGNATDSERLLAMLRKIADELRAQAGKVEHSEEYVPPGFATIQGGRDEEAEIAPRYEPRPSASGEGGEKSTTNTPTDVHDDSIDPPERRRRRRRRRKRNRGARPKPGKRVGGRLSLRALPGNNGILTRLLVSWRPGDNDRDGRSYLAGPGPEFRRVQMRLVTCRFRPGGCASARSTIAARSYIRIPMATRLAFPMEIRTLTFD